MTGITNYSKKLFDTLSNLASEEPTQHGIYADTRSKDGLYSITNTQSGTSTYAAGQTRTKQEPALYRDVDSTETFDCEDPQTCPRCSPFTVGDD
ncbi:hypothetical protein [Natronorubrum thiooxidans]|uniref:Uncharacterized protein n=1 Tax=Natronorubrum thiooxidans TaxID=308853 RepID=A0A1N7H5F2_9EURY|nr:hypothetical protein [Natronorubrum thiooxidans]SIS19930.1 hypothetical protein SAMN05421752_12523 [Natronorubrum thiooxidans]